ncbi:MAG: hypothetical protein WAZ38_04140 [Prolixibacteraceae bacterium]
MSNLISGKEALIALANGEVVQVRNPNDTWYKDWTDYESFKFKMWIGYFTDGASQGYEFRLKPRTITLNNIEVPAPFEPKDGDTVFVLANFLQQGYLECKYPTFESHVFQFGAWRTKEEIKQVVAAHRNVFGGSK